jgi:hypothetical protein
VQLPVAGSGLGENEGLRAARRRSRWLRESSETEKTWCVAGLLWFAGVDL